MKIKNFFIFLSFLPLLLLYGCWDVNEAERMLYINGVGVDYKDGQYEVYAQIVDFANIAKSEQPNTSAVQTEVGSAKGKTIEEAIFKLYRSSDQRIFWGTFAYLVLSEDVLANGRANPIIDTFNRYRETRYQIWVYSTKDPVKDILLLTPIINKAITVSKLDDPRNSFTQESFVEPIDIRKFIIGMNEPSHEVSIPYISIKKNWETKEGINDTTFLSGVGVITPNEFKGFLAGDKARGLQWMTNEIQKGEVTISVGSGENAHLTVDIDKLKMKILPIVDNTNVKFDVTLQIDASINGLKGNISQDDVRKGIHKEISKEIKETYQEALKKDMDIYRFSEQLYRKNNKTWKKIQKDGKIELSEDSIRNISVKVDNLKTGKKIFKETIEK